MIKTLNKYKKQVFLVLLVLFIADLALSFIQYYHLPLDGDFATLIAPSDAYKEVFKDPFGFNVFTEPHAVPNAYFHFKFTQVYFTNVPLLLQTFLNPIESLYASIALLKTGTQLLLIYLLSVYATGKTKFTDSDNILNYLLLFPLFSVYKYANMVGIIDTSIIYAITYSTAPILILIYFLPFVLKYYHKNKEISFNGLFYITYIVLAIISTLNGTLNAPMAILISFFTFLYYGILNSENYNPISIIKSVFKNTPKPILILFSWITILSFYSLLLSSYNTERHWATLSIFERYKVLPKGISTHFFGTFGMSLLSSYVFLQAYFLFRNRTITRKKKIIILYLFSFIIIYLLFLPFGGYKSYRPLIVRRDTFIPVFFVLMILLVYLTKENWSYQKRIQKLFLSSLLIITLLDFKIGDLKILKKNDCEISQLKLLQKSKDKIVTLPKTCSCLTWGFIDDYNWSNYNVLVLNKLNILKNKEIRYYYSKEN